jgi:hypothetical protein
MFLYVIIKMPLGLERFVTALEGALERALPSMNAHMGFQVSLFIEALAAIFKRTQERTIPSLRIKKVLHEFFHES